MDKEPGSDGHEHHVAHELVQAEREMLEIAESNVSTKRKFRRCKCPSR